MKKQKKYKYSYNTYQKNAILLIALLLLSGGCVLYYHHLNYSPEDDFDDETLQVSTEKIKDRTIKDINAELDNLLQQDAPVTYDDRRYSKYDNDYQKYLDSQESKKQGLEDYKQKAEAERKARYKAQEKRAIEEREKILRKQREEERERIRKQQQILDDQRRREYEAQQKQLQRVKNNGNNATQNNQNWASTNFVQQPKPAEKTEEEKAAERMRKEMERQQKLDAIKNNKNITPEQQKKIDECQRREARKQAQLDRRRQAPIKSTHKKLPNFQPQVNAPEQGGCEECARY